MSQKNIPAIYQGGESTIGSETVSDLLFNFQSKLRPNNRQETRHARKLQCDWNG